MATTSTAPHVSEIRRLAEAAVGPCTDFIRDLVSIPSPSRAERFACERVERELISLGFEDVQTDGLGNVLGRLGSGPRVLAFDAHVDTVGITSPTRWKFDPFAAEIDCGVLYGRGASDQKGGLGAMVHGLAALAKIGIPDDLTVWITATVLGEDCVGLSWKYLIEQEGLIPEAVVIATPSHLGICHAQRGRLEVEITSYGVSTHGSQPERGTNAVVLMAPVIDAVSHMRLAHEHPVLGRGSVAVTGVRCQSPSLTAIPDECTIHVDRRVTVGEECHKVVAQLKELPAVVAAGAEVQVLRYDLPSWRGTQYPMEKFFPAWSTAPESPLVRAGVDTARLVLDRDPRIIRSSFSSTGCVTAGMFGVPTIGFGPADEIHSHTVHDQLPLIQLAPAMAFYALLPISYVSSCPEPPSP